MIPQIVLTIVAAVCVPKALAEQAKSAEIPLGHRDYYPTPDRPVGFRGNGNGYFPGATPVTTWREGQVNITEIKKVDKHGREKTDKGPVFKAGPSKNIVWKTEMPGWANSQPIIVGDRAFTTAEPNLLVCVDMKTGKILWQRANNPFQYIAGVTQQEAEKLYELVQIGKVTQVVTRTIEGSGGGGKRLAERNKTPEGKKFLATAVEHLKHLRSQAANIDSAKAHEAFDELIVSVEAALQGKGKVRKVEHAVGVFGQKHGVPVVPSWMGQVGWTAPTPCSDGQFVYVVMGQGQVACFDLGGNLKWGRHFPQHVGGRWRVQHVPSPVLVGDVLIAMFGDKVRGLNTATGATLWERKDLVGGGYNVGTFKHLQLPHQGRILNVIVTTRGHVVRPSDGKTLADLGWSEGKEGGSPSIVGRGTLFFHDIGKKGKYFGSRLEVISKDAVRGEDIYQLEGTNGPPATPTLTDGVLAIGTTLYDIKTGKRLHRASRHSALGFRGEWESNIVCGNLLIGVADAENRGYTRTRLDNMTYAELGVVNIADPESPSIVSRRNWLGGVNKPRFPALEAHLPQVYKDGAVRWDNYGVPPQFGLYNSGMFAQGNRLLFRSVSHLYCIGDPDNPYDGPKAQLP